MTIKKTLILIVFILAINSLRCQVSFEKGYFIKNDGSKIECFIKNQDWKYNPDRFHFKTSENSNDETISISDVKEFGIINKSKYVRELVMVDQSSTDVEKLSPDRNPNFTEKLIFLKALVEGKSSLYFYQENNDIRFFYSNINNSKIEQLIYKSYVDENKKILQNNQFRQQLFNDLKCPSISAERINTLKYNKGQLVKFFLDYNNCHESLISSYEPKQQKNNLHLSIKPGIRSNKFQINREGFDDRTLDYGNIVSYRLGLEAEYILPFNSNKWSILLEPTIHSFNGNKSSNLKANNNQESEQVDLDYKSIEFSLGARHYLYLSNNSKLFFNTFYVFDFNGSSSITFEVKSDLEISQQSYFSVGLGYMYADKFSLEVRNGFNNDVLWNVDSYSSDYKNISLILGYKFL